MAFTIQIAPQRAGRRDGVVWCVSLSMLITSRAPSTRAQKPARGIARPYLVTVNAGGDRKVTDYATESEARAAYLAA